MTSFKVYALIGAVSAVAAFGAAWKIQHWRYEAAEKAAIEAALEAQKAKLEKNYQADKELIKKQAESEIRYKTVTEKVIEYVETQHNDPVCFDDRAVRLYNESRSDANTLPGKNDG